MHMYDTAGTDHQVDSGSGLLVQGAWTHIGCTYDGGSGYGSFYANGQLVAQTFLGKDSTAKTNGDFWFGNTPGEYKGMIDEMTFYGRPLTPGEMAAIYNFGANGKAPPNAGSPPVVNAGPDLIVSTVPGSAALNGTVTPGSLLRPLNIAWSELDGPATVTFANPNSAATTATFSVPVHLCAGIGRQRRAQRKAAPGIITVIRR